MEHYHLPTNQLLSRDDILSITGIDIQTTCLENLLAAGIYPVEDKLSTGLLDNPNPVFILKDQIAQKVNSDEPIPLSEAKAKTTLFLKEEGNKEISRVMRNTGYSETIFSTCLFLTPEERSNELNSLVNCVKTKTKKLIHLVGQVEQTTSVEELKQLLKEFEQSEDLHGDP